MNESSGNSSTPPIAHSTHTIKKKKSPLMATFPIFSLVVRITGTLVLINRAMSGTKRVLLRRPRRRDEERKVPSLCFTEYSPHSPQLAGQKDTRTNGPRYFYLD